MRCYPQYHILWIHTTKNRLLYNLYRNFSPCLLCILHIFSFKIARLVIKTSKLSSIPSHLFHIVNSTKLEDMIKQTEVKAAVILRFYVFDQRKINPSALHFFHIGLPTSTTKKFVWISFTVDGNVNYRSSYNAISIPSNFHSS